MQAEINGTLFDRALPAGANTDSIAGQPLHGQPYRVGIEFPATLLRVSTNDIRIRTVSGSWFLYNAIALYGPPEIAVAPASGSQ